MPGTYLVRLMHTNSCRLYPGHSMLILYRFLPPPETSWNSIRVAFILSWIGSQPWFWTSDVLPEGRFHRKHSETLCFNGFVWVYPTCSGTLPFFKRFSIMQFFPWTNPRKIHISGGSDPWKARFAGGRSRAPGPALARAAAAGAPRRRRRRGGGFQQGAAPRRCLQGSLR